MKFLVFAMLLVFLAPGALAKPAGLLPRVLHPAYWDWVRRPGEMYGFWLWVGPVGVQDQIDRTGASATSMHLIFHPVEDGSAALGVRPLSPGEQLANLPAISEFMAKNRMDAGVGIGEHNNAAFVRYPDWFWKKLPDAAMRDREGRIIKAGDASWPALDDASLRALGERQMADMAGYLGAQEWVRYWVLGGEEMYPDYLGLPEGDFRPTSLRHFAAWKGSREQRAESGDGWRAFRESAMVDHFAGYAAYLRGIDPTRPILIPTHGNPFALDFRSKLGYAIAELAGAGDGFEAGPIAIGDDDERLVRMTLDMQSSFGVPVTAPRIADKILDPTATGGGRSFSPASVRRFVYEALGMGAWHIGLVQWAGTLADGEWGIAGTEAEAECRKLFDELRRAGPYLDNCSRLQPQVGLFISDATWREWWRDRWTLAYDQAIKRGWCVTPVTDAQLGADLAASMPVILSVDNQRIPDAAHRRLAAYKRAGGRVIEIGSTIPDDEQGAVAVVHRTHTTTGANEWRGQVKPLPMDAVEAAIGHSIDLKPVIVTEAGKRVEGVEVLPLTDGTNVIAVIVNRTHQKREVNVSLSAHLRSRIGSISARDAISGEAVPVANSSAKVSLAASGTALIAFERVVSSADATHEVAAAREAVERWRALGADVKMLSGLVDFAESHVEPKRYAKAHALARTVTSALALKTTSRLDSDALRVQAKVWTADGEPATGANVRMRIVPGPFEWRKLRQTSPGVYSLSVPRGSLPTVYDAQIERYDLPNGAIELIFDASLDGHNGAIRGILQARKPER